VVLRFDKGQWSVEASRGQRRLGKAAQVRPGVVKALADQLDESPVREALIDTIDSCRSVAEACAAALRAELQAAESALRDYDIRAGSRARQGQAAKA
jgi:hypothetical protein